MSKLTPPPIPQRDPSQAPIKRAVFSEGKKIRMGHVTFDYSLIEASHEKAETWINQNPQIQLVQIQTFHSTMSGITVVWYR